jgi:hypothetical protein
MLPLRCRFLRRRAKLVQVQLSSRWRRQGLRVPLHRAPRRAGPRRHPPVCALHGAHRMPLADEALLARGNRMFTPCVCCALPAVCCNAAPCPPPPPPHTPTPTHPHPHHPHPPPPAHHKPPSNNARCSTTTRSPQPPTSSSNLCWAASAPMAAPSWPPCSPFGPATVRLQPKPGSCRRSARPQACLALRLGARQRALRLASKPWTTLACKRAIAPCLASASQACRDCGQHGLVKRVSQGRPDSNPSCLPRPPRPPPPPSPSSSRLQLHQEPLQPGLRNSRPHAAPPRCEPPIRRCLSSLQPPSSTGGRFQQRIAAAAWHAGFSVRASAAAALRTLSQPPLLPFSSPPLPLNRPLRRWMAC